MDHRKNIVHASLIGTLDHYQLIERRIAATKAQAQRLKRQPPAELSARQQRKADKARRRVDRVRRDALTDKDMKHVENEPPLKAAFDEGMAILDEAYKNRQA